MNESAPPVNRFWMACVASCSFLAVSLAGFWLYFSLFYERSLLRNPAVTGGIVLLLAGAIYGMAEVARWFRRRAPRVSLPLCSLFVVTVLLSGGLLIINSLLARKRSADTRTIEGLRVVEETRVAPSR